MATSVTVLCPNGRRVAIKVTPATPLLQVLEEACRKQKMDPAKHALKHGSKRVDLTALYRYTNIPRNGHLEMVAANRSSSSSEVALAVQCVDGSRHQVKFTDSSTSLWDVLVKVGVVSDTGESVVSGEPVVVYMNTHVCGEGALRGRSLKDLGLTAGRAALRFLHRQTNTDTTEPSVATPTQPTTPTESQTDNEPTSHEQSSTSADVTMETSSKDSPMEDAIEHPRPKPISHVTSEEDPRPKPISHVTNEEDPRPKPISHVTNEEDPRPKPTSHVMEEYFFPAHPISYFPDSKHTPSVPPDTGHTPSLPPGLSSTDVVPTHTFDLPLLREDSGSWSVRASAQPVITSRVYAEPCERERVVYHLDDPLPLPSLEEVSDEFFAVTQKDVLIMQDDLKKQVAMEGTPLLTSAMRQVLKEKRFEGYSHTIIRVHFPDRWVLQGVFRPQESLKALVKFVRGSLADPGLKFHLYTTPPKTVLRSGRPTLLEAGFVPAAIIHLGAEGSAATPTLSRECLETAQSALHAEVAIAEKRCSGLSSSVQPQGSVESGEDRKSAVSAAVGKTVPKWFRIGK